ncbi:hypothetical protein NHH03_15000 [Stieleria sp. TO1_6]|uniref:hypothetical protein n=1 Tax=Stieleria tagensis TaxID=2956795 RepID=UPI00209AA7C6|nr:hypothetical protein [Stieleria tagensis]MCO8123053.1 hypothetical protein [Stieleria tagensis]
MTDPSDLNALYQDWLEIPAHRLPPNHYALLGIEDFESDPQLIEAAAKSRGAYLHQIAAGPQRKSVQEMLRQVAVARRTLLSDTSKADYDTALRTPQSPENQPSEIQPPQPTARTTPADNNAAAEPNPTAAPRRKKAADWKYHVISAAVLLGIVGMVFWVNRDPGGRRAAQLASPTSASSTPKASKQTAQSGQAANGGARKAPATTPGNRSVARKPIIAPRRETGSGLGMGLNNKFGDVLADIASQEATGEPKSDPAGFQPLGGLSIGPVKNEITDSDQPTDLQPVEAFPEAIAQRFESESGLDWFTVDAGRLQINVAKQKNSFQLSDRQFQLAPGAAVQLTTSLASGMRGEVRVGFVIDGVRLGLRPKGNGLEVTARDRGAEASVDSVTKLPGKTQQATFTVIRATEDPNTLRWTLSAGDKQCSGSVIATNLADQAGVALFAIAPKSDMKQSLWISDLKTTAEN